MRGQQNRLLGYSIPTKLVIFSCKSVAEKNPTYKHTTNSKKKAQPLSSSWSKLSFFSFLLTRRIESVCFLNIYSSCMWIGHRHSDTYSYIAIIIIFCWVTSSWQINTQKFISKVTFVVLWTFRRKPHQLAVEISLKILLIEHTNLKHVGTQKSKSTNPTHNLVFFHEIQNQNQ